MENKKGRVKTPKVGNTEVYSYGASEYLSMDIGEYQNQYFLAARDKTSSFVMAEPIPKQTSRNVIKVLEMWMSKVGIPVVIRADGGSCFTSQEFGEFCSEYYIKLVHSSPYNHSSNGAGESAVHVCKEIPVSYTHLTLPTKRIV